MPQLLSRAVGCFECHVEQCVEMRGGYLLERIFKSYRIQKNLLALCFQKCNVVCVYLV